MTILAMDPPVSEAQRRAMWAAAEGRSTLGIPRKVGQEFVKDAADEAPLNAAGVLVRNPNGSVLFLKRSQKGDHGGEWCLPGGGSEDGETPEETARRELDEETAYRGGRFWHVHHTPGKTVNFHTFLHEAPEEFSPRLNDEHTEFAWADPSSPPEPLHPGVAELLKGLSQDAEWERQQLALKMPKIVNRELSKTGFAQDEDLAFDRESVRSFDAEGRLHVTDTNISKSNICEYLGREIPNWQVLGLNPDQRYKLLRDPEELAKAAPTFNGLQLLRRHVPVSAEDPKQWETIGALGTNAYFEAPYLRNGLTVWVKDAIDSIFSGDKEELSCSYRYRADMTPGEYLGEQYHGVMRDIEGNHVALVKKGRAGSDVVVGDSALVVTTTEEQPMPIKTKSRVGLYVHGALSTFFKKGEPAGAILALDEALSDVTGANFTERKSKIKVAITNLKAAGFANDADLDGMHSFIDRLDKQPVEDNEPSRQPPDANDDEPTKYLKGKLSAEDYKAFDAMVKDKAAKDAEEDEKVKKEEEEKRAKDNEDKVSKHAMDSAIAEATKSTRAQVIKDQQEIRDAERTVRPWVGELTLAFDSAESVYRHALGILKVEHKDVHASALSHILKAQPVPGTKPRTPRQAAPVFAADSSDAQSFAKRFPAAAQIRTL